MTHQLAAQQCQAAADFISRMVKQGHIPDGDRSEACDRAIDLNLLAKRHLKEAAVPVASTEDNELIESE